MRVTLSFWNYLFCIELSKSINTDNRSTCCGSKGTLFQSKINTNTSEIIDKNKTNEVQIHED